MSGLRATRQRVAVLRLLRGAHGHPTAADLHRQLLKEQPTVGLKTVYDALDSLVSAGIAACVAHGGAPCRYEANVGPHYHVECRACGSLIDVPARADRQIRGRTPLPAGFEIDEIHVTLRGRCPRCRKEGLRSPP
jgi:Fe2+ or Zn2+ uptake regulation protein